MNKKELEKERVEAFDDWLDWWNEESNAFKDIEEQIKKRNLEGYTDIEIEIEYTEGQPYIRLESNLFIERLKKRFQGFSISKTYISSTEDYRHNIGMKLRMSWD